MEIAHHYGLDPENWPAWKKQAYLAAIPRMEAKEMRLRLMTSGIQVTSDFVYDLTLMETGDEEKAAEAKFQHLRAQMLAGRKAQ